MSSTGSRADDARGVALNLAPLLVPYKKHGRLTLRIERLPQKARLSKGNRNNDGSWSLATDELEDLLYLSPEGAAVAEHALAIRIIGLTNGNTLAVLDFIVSSENAAAPLAEARDDAQVQLLRDELAKMKAALAARDSESPPKAQPVQTETSRHDIESELAAAHATWTAELNERLAAVGTQAALELRRHRAAWEAEHTERLSKFEALAQQRLADATQHWQQESRDALAKAEQTWKTEEAARLAAAEAQWQEAADKIAADAWARADLAREQERERERHALREELSTLQAALAERKTVVAEAQSASERRQQEAQDALVKAEEIWKAAEAERFAAAEAKWRESSAKALAEARTQTDSARNESQDAELRSLRAELATQKKFLAERESALAAAQKADERRQDEARDALQQAQNSWKTGEDKRLAAAEEQWREDTAKAVADARTQSGATRNEAQDKELQTLRTQLAAQKKTLSERDAALADAQKANERRQDEARDALKKAEQGWKADEAKRLAAAEAQWQAKSAKALAAARLEADAAQDNELPALREQLSALQATLTQHEAELAAAQAEIEAARTRFERTAHDAPAKTERSDKADVAALLAAAETEWRKKYASALADATSRYEAAESALMQVRIKQKDEGRLHLDLSATRAALAVREGELADLRAAAGLEQEHAGDGDGAASPGEADAAVEATGAKPAAYSRQFIGGVIAAACLVMAVVVFYPEIEALIFSAPPPPVKSATVPKVEAKAAPVAVEAHATLLREAKLRAEPATTAKVVATLTRGAEITVVEDRGKWVLVRAGDANGKTNASQGWVSRSLLKDLPASDATPIPAKPK